MQDNKQIPVITDTSQWLVSMPVDLALVFGVKAPRMPLYWTPSGKCVVQAFNGREPDVLVKVAALGGKLVEFILVPNADKPLVLLPSGGKRGHYVTPEELRQGILRRRRKPTK